MLSNTLSSSLRTLVAREQANIELIAQRAAQLISSSVSDYSLSADPRIAHDLRASARANAELWFAALLEEKPVELESLEPVIVYARRRVHQGITLTSLLRAYRIITRVFWTQLIQAAGDDLPLVAEMTAKVLPELFEHFDTVAESITAHYQAEQAQHARWRDRLRQDLWDIVRSRPNDVDGFRSRADSLGLDSERPYCAVAMRLSEEARVHPERYIDPLLLSLARRQGIPTDGLMRAIDRDHFIIWVPQQPELTAIPFERSLADAAAATGSASKAVISVGVGLPGLGPRGWLASMEQAFRAETDPLARSAEGGAHRYSRICVDDAIRASLNVSEYVRSTLGTLSVEPALLDTLRAYLGNGLQRKGTAYALGVHPNTLDNRLSRIESLLDGSFSDVAWIERIGIALRLCQPRHRL